MDHQDRGGRQGCQGSSRGKEVLGGLQAGVARASRQVRFLSLHPRACAARIHQTRLSQFHVADDANDPTLSQRERVGARRERDCEQSSHAAARCQTTSRSIGAFVFSFACRG